MRGTVRSASKGQSIIDRYPEHKDALDIVAVEDIATSDLSEAVNGVSAIMHVASPVRLLARARFSADDSSQYTFAVENIERDLLKPAINGTTNVCKAAMAAGVKRIVITSSFAAINDMEGKGVWQCVPLPCTSLS